MNIWLFSPYLITIFIAWFGSHIIKYVVKLIKDRKTKILSVVFISGGMPSAHSATVISLATIIGLIDGFNSGLFALALLLAIIIIYDSFKLRRSSGEQGFAIHSLIKEQKSSVKLPMISEGHTAKEVVIGALFGIFIGIVVFLSTR